MSKRIAILQSSYIPWKGYFDIIRIVDEFILYEDAQYTKRDWRNRNKIKTAQGPAWLTIPVKSKGKFLQAIKDTEAQGTDWRQKHWKAIEVSYAKTAHFKQYAGLFSAEYEQTEINLSKINIGFLTLICQILGIHTKMRTSTEFKLTGDRTERLVSICEQSGATEYLSGPSAQNYIQPQYFKEAGIKLEYMDYVGYPEYGQLFPPFEHGVSIIDLIFNTGERASEFMKGL